MEYTSINALNFKMKVQITGSTKQAYKALLRIYKNQTAAEQTVGATVVYNNIGFTGADAPILSSFAKQLEKKGCLSEKQNSFLMKKIGKYAAQLVKMSIKDKMIIKVNGKYIVNTVNNG